VHVWLSAAQPGFEEALVLQAQQCFASQGLRSLLAVQKAAKELLRIEAPLKWALQLGEVMPHLIMEALQELVDSTAAAAAALPPAPPS
jgi:hypothetical protein